MTSRVLALLALACGVGCDDTSGLCVDDAYEDDDRVADAPLFMDGEQRHVSCPGDRDVFAWAWSDTPVRVFYDVYSSADEGELAGSSFVLDTTRGHLQLRGGNCLQTEGELVIENRTDRPIPYLITAETEDRQCD